MRYLENKYDFPAGEIISIPFHGVLRHYGVVTARGSVISNSRAGGGVIEQSLTDFENGKSVRRHGASSSEHAFQIEARARRKLGRPYDLTGSNCIDFTRHTHKRAPTPWQFARAGLMALDDMLGGRKPR